MPGTPHSGERAGGSYGKEAISIGKLTRPEWEVQSLLVAQSVTVSCC